MFPREDEVEKSKINETLDKSEQPGWCNNFDIINTRNKKNWKTEQPLIVIRDQTIFIGIRDREIEYLVKINGGPVYPEVSKPGNIQDIASNASSKYSS